MKAILLTVFAIALGPGCASETSSEPNTKGPSKPPEEEKWPREQLPVDRPREIAVGTFERPDRCLVESCGNTNLPDQSELEFLEDMGRGWKRLIEMDWEVGPGAEGYRCKTFTLPEDVYISEFSPQAPYGTHHTTFGVLPEPIGPDRIATCGVQTLGERMLQAGGPGAKPSKLPLGVAMPLPRGAQIFMNVHLFNLTDEPLSGRSGMWVKTVPGSEVELTAENVPAGPLQLNIPRGRSKQVGVCTLRADATLITVSPHMHRTGIHMRATATTAKGEVSIYDGDYDFNHQIVYDVGPFEFQAGDRVNIECTYENDTDSPLRWGDSGLDEMCVFGMILYPAFNYGADPCDS